MAIREYIGARYVPKFMGLWDNTQEYEALSVVDNGLGTSYISKIPVPAGTPLTDTNYWIISGSTNGAIIQLQNQMDLYLESFVTPEMFGAAGDGSTDDSAAVQDAVDSGCAVLFKNKYLTKHVAINKKVVLFGPGTIVLDTSGGTSYNKTAFYVNEECVMDGLTFEGIIYTPDTPGDTNRETPIVAKDINSLRIENCFFTKCGCEYLYNETLPLWERRSAILSATNVLNMIFTGNTIDSCRNELLRVIPDDTLDPSVITSIYFANNIIKNQPGKSISLHAKVVDVRDNLIEKYTYAGSIFNMSGDNVNISGDEFVDVDVDSCYDCNEGLLFHADKLSISSVHASGTINKFITTSSRLLDVSDNIVECSSFIFNDVGTRYDVIVPPTQANTTVKMRGSMRIKNNTVTINNNAQDSAIIRQGCGFSHASDDPVDDCGTWTQLDVSGNVFDCTIPFEVIANKTVIYILAMFRQVNVNSNIFRSMNGDNIKSVAYKFILYIYVGSLTPSRFIDYLQMIGNVLERGNSSITDTAPVWTNRSGKTIETAYIYYNKMSGSCAISNGMTSSNYDTLNTDVPI